MDFREQEDEERLRRTRRIRRISVTESVFFVAIAVLVLATALLLVIDTDQVGPAFWLRLFTVFTGMVTLIGLHLLRGLRRARNDAQNYLLNATSLERELSGG